MSKDITHLVGQNPSVVLKDVGKVFQSNKNPEKKIKVVEVRSRTLTTFQDKKYTNIIHYSTQIKDTGLFNTGASFMNEYEFLNEYERSE